MWLLILAGCGVVAAATASKRKVAPKGNAYHPGTKSKDGHESLQVIETIAINERRLNMYRKNPKSRENLLSLLASTETRYWCLFIYTTYLFHGFAHRRPLHLILTPGSIRLWQTLACING
jgi:hypothetical protein